MKKTKLFMTIASMCFAIAVLVFGVFASRQVTYQINGTITYEVKDCYILVETKLYYNLTYLTQDEMYERLEDIVNDADYGSLQLDSSYLYNSYTDTYEGADHQEIDIQFRGGTVAPRLAYFIVLEVTNLGSNQINLAVNTPTDIPYNVYSINSGLITSAEQQVEPYIMVIAFSLEDVTSKITTKHPGQDPSYSVSLKAELDDEDSELNVFDFNRSTKAISKTEKLENMEADLYVPSYVNCEKVLIVQDFSDCVNLTSIFIPSSVHEIGESVFANCPSLTSITIPFVGKKNYQSRDEVVSYEEGYWLRSTYYHLFDNEEEDGLVQIRLYPDDEVYGYNVLYGAYIPENLTQVNILYGCKAICEEAFNVIEGPNNPMQYIKLPYGLTRIEDSAFRACDDLQIVQIPKTLRYLGESCFKDCDRLTSITIPGTVSVIGDEAFSACTDLEFLTICEGVTRIGSGSFNLCIGLESVDIPGSVTRIDYEAFRNCYNLESVTFHEGLIHIDDYVFRGCNLLTTVSFPPTLNYIGQDAFSDCTNLKTVYLNSQVNFTRETFFYSYPGYYFEEEDGYYIYVPDKLFYIYANNVLLEDYVNAGVIRSVSNINAYRVTYEVQSENMNYPYMSLLIRDPKYWHQFDSTVVSRDKMNSSENAIYKNTTNGFTNAIYSDINIIPNDDVVYNIYIRKCYKVYIYLFDFENNNQSFISGEYQFCYKYPSENGGNIFENIRFGMGINKIRFVLVRYDDEECTIEHTLKPSQITTSQFYSLRLTPENYFAHSSEERNGSFVGYYKPGYAFDMPMMVTSPNNKGYEFFSWLVDNENEGSVINGQSADKVVENGTTTVYAEWIEPFMELYFKLNFDGTESYIKIDGLNSLYGLDNGDTHGYNNKIPLRVIFNTVFAMPAVKSLMTSKGISYDSSGYPTNYQPEKILMKSGTRGSFKMFDSEDGYSRVFWDEMDDWVYAFSTGDGYIYLSHWEQISSSVSILNTSENSTCVTINNYQACAPCVSVDPKDIFKRFANETYFVLPKSSYFNQETKAVAY